MLIKRVSPVQAKDCGEVVADAETKEMLHYTERPVRTVDPPVRSLPAHAVERRPCRSDDVL